MSLYLEEKYFHQNQRIIEYFLIGGIFFYHFFETDSITLRFIILFAFLLSCLFQKSFHQINNVRSFIFILLISIFLIFYHGLPEAKDFFIFCFGILSISYLSRIYMFSGNLIYKFFIYVIIPLSLKNLILYGNVSYFPFTTGYINIIGNEATKHGTAIVGTVLFVGAIYNILKSKGRIFRKDVFFLLISFYFILFSGSRSSLMALLATIILYIINHNKYRKNVTIVYICIMFLGVFFLEYLQDYIYLINNEVVLDLIGAKNFKTHGVTSGRAWLWNYHWDSFVNSPYLLGGGRMVTDFRVGDYIPSLRVKAEAGSESPYTGMLACYGIIAIIQFGILISLIYNAINKKNLLATCILFIAIYNTIMGLNLTYVLSAEAILLYLLYFASFKNDNITIKV